VVVLFVNYVYSVIFNILMAISAWIGQLDLYYVVLVDYLKRAPPVPKHVGVDTMNCIL